MKQASIFALLGRQLGGRYSHSGFLYMYGYPVVYCPKKFIKSILLLIYISIPQNIDYIKVSLLVAERKLIYLLYFTFYFFVSFLFSNSLQLCQNLILMYK